MEGLYTSPDASLQVAIAHADDRWRLVAVKEDDQGELTEWCCEVVKKDDVYKVEQTTLFFERGAVLRVDDDTVEWPDGTLWRRLACTPMQLYLMGRRRPFYTPMAMYLCVMLYTFVKSRAFMAAAYATNAYKALQAWRRKQKQR